MWKLLRPSFFMKWSKILLPYICGLFTISLLATIWAISNSPNDYQQGILVMIMYIHVPAAWMALGIFSFIAICSFSNIIWRSSLSYIFAISAAPIGAVFALITLVTGSIWGKPTWGTWWVWDARLTSMLILFLLYMAYITVVNSGDHIMRAEKPASAIALICFVNVPIVKFSVDLWSSLHQNASVIKFGGPAIHHTMLTPLILSAITSLLYFIIIFILRARTILLKNRLEEKK